jgi:hypothetical protein
VADLCSTGSYFYGSARGLKRHACLCSTVTILGSRAPWTHIGVVYIRDDKHNKLHDKVCRSGRAPTTRKHSCPTQPRITSII